MYTCIFIYIISYNAKDWATISISDSMHAYRSIRAWSVLELDVSTNMFLFTKNWEKREENTVRK